MLEDIRSILVIDDEFDIVNPIKLSLKRQGFNAYGFTDPLLAFEHFKNNSENIDLILCDIRMPQMNGYELVKKIKALQPKVGVILMSAFEINDLEFSKILPYVKIDGFISKPISLKNLTTRVKKYLNNG
ncbi:MAG TPA: response regulator [Nitrososphaeraceae archaeon]|nr:response regulator [Nitrososphaeraceae archaeon]